MALTIAEWANMVSAISAATAAVFSAVTIMMHRKTIIQQRAAESVKKYVELAIQNPKLSGSKKEDQYDWFVSFLLITVRDILRAHKNDQSWRAFVDNQLDWFADDLAAWKKYDDEHKTNFLRHFGPDVESAVNAFLARKRLA